MTPSRTAIRSTVCGHLPESRPRPRPAAETRRSGQFGPSDLQRGGKLSSAADAQDSRLVRYVIPQEPRTGRRSQRGLIVEGCHRLHDFERRGGPRGPAAQYGSEPGVRQLGGQGRARRAGQEARHSRGILPPRPALPDSRPQSLIDHSELTAHRSSRFTAPEEARLRFLGCDRRLKPEGLTARTRQVIRGDLGMDANSVVRHLLHNCVAQSAPSGRLAANGVPPREPLGAHPQVAHSDSPVVPAEGIRLLVIDADVCRTAHMSTAVQQQRTLR